MARRTITARQAIERFEEAVRADEVRGAQPPETWEGIETELREARDDLVTLSAGIVLHRNPRKT
jgi:hypothetical protein